MSIEIDQWNIIENLEGVPDTWIDVPKEAFYINNKKDEITAIHLEK